MFKFFHCFINDDYRTAHVMRDLWFLITIPVIALLLKLCGVWFSHIFFLRLHHIKRTTLLLFCLEVNVRSCSHKSMVKCAAKLVLTRFIIAVIWYHHRISALIKSLMLIFLIQSSTVIKNRDYSKLRRLSSVVMVKSA